MSGSTANCPEITPDFIAELSAQLRAGERINRALPAGGRLHLDRPLPFLCVHRLRSSDAGSRELLLGQSSFLLAPQDGEHAAEIAASVEAIAHFCSEHSGAFLLVEVWTRPDESDGAFRIYSGEEAGQTPVATSCLENALSAMNWPPFAAQVSVEPLGNALEWQPLLSEADAAQLGCRVIGLEVPPRFRAAPDGPIFPASLRVLRRELGRALQKTCAEFMRVQTTESIEDFRALGVREVGAAVWECDAQLAQIAADWNFLLAVTPVNAQSAWDEFRASDFGRTPVFHDRLLPFDPDLLKRKLYNIEIERVESPALANLFREKRGELDRQITLLEDRQTPRFLFGSLALYGGVEPSLLELARQILARTGAQEDESLETVSATQFAARAQSEIDFYRAQWPELDSRVEVRSDVPGVMVAAGQLLIGGNFRYPAARLDALIQHEVGTHIVSHANGRAQRLKLLYIGFPDYDPLQEGTAVLSEWLINGLHSSRLRILAARVWAIHAMIRGADFVETFRALCDDYGYDARESWSLTMRVYRGGGFTKDAIYLRGLVWLLDYLKNGGEFELLWSGKISAGSLELVRELGLRGIIGPMPLRPRFLDEAGTQQRLELVRGGLTVLDLLEGGAT